MTIMWSMTIICERIYDKRCEFKWEYLYSNQAYRTATYVQFAWCFDDKMGYSPGLALAGAQLQLGI